ncbi:MAG TPA: histidine kinase [Desulfomicrobium sp.]|nr:histidine kinase [Desulfomicrobium sp.]
MMTNQPYENDIVQEDAIDLLEIFQRLKEGVAVLRNGRFAFANPAFVDITGCRPDALMGIELPEPFPGPEQAAILRDHEDVLRSGNNSRPREFWIETPAGRARIEMTMAPLGSGKAAEVLLTVVDVTPKRRRMDEIRELSDRLESILHSMHDVVVSLSAEDGRILSINPAAELLYGVPLRNLAGAAESDIVALAHPGDSERVWDFYRSVREKEFDELEYRIVRSDGKVRWVRDEGYVVSCRSRDRQRIDHMIRDITEERRAILELHRSEQRYKDFFHKTKDMAFSVSPSGLFLDINDAGIGLLGLSCRKAALSSSVYDFVERPAALDEMLRELNEKGHVSNRSVTLKPASGAHIEVDITARAKRSESGEVLYYEGIASNITQALEDQRNRVLRNTAASMCHYLNSHLMHISVALDGMKEELSEMDERFMTSARTEEKDEVWTSGREALNGYVRDVNLAYRKISELTRAFNSAFLTYREESYLDKTILDIFGACRPD